MIESHATDSILVKVIDFGVSKVVASRPDLGADRTRARFVGTAAFAGPEQFAEAGQSRVDMRSDIYSLGVTFWYLLCGRTPFGGGKLEEIRARQSGEPPVESLRVAHVPAPVVGLLKSMLASDPAYRSRSARELLALVHRSDFGIWWRPSKDVFAPASEITQAVAARVQPGHRPDEKATLDIASTTENDCQITLGKIRQECAT